MSEATPANEKSELKIKIDQAQEVIKDIRVMLSTETPKPKKKKKKASKKAKSSRRSHRHGREGTKSVRMPTLGVELETATFGQKMCWYANLMSAGKYQSRYYKKFDIASLMAALSEVGANTSMGLILQQNALEHMCTQAGDMSSEQWRDLDGSEDPTLLTEDERCTIYKALLDKVTSQKRIQDAFPVGRGALDAYRRVPQDSLDPQRPTSNNLGG